MDIILDKNINNYPQIKGIGESITTFVMEIDVGTMINLNDTRKIIISMRLEVNGFIYYYNNIHSISEINNDGKILIGEVTVLGKVKVEDIVTVVEIIYLENPSI